MALKEMTTCRLERYTVRQDLPLFVEVLSIMSNLDALVFAENSLGGASTYELCDLLQRHKRNFLPKLNTLTLHNPFRDAVDSMRFFESVREHHALCSVEVFELRGSNDVELDAIARVFSGDMSAFSCLRQLLLKDLKDETGGAFASLCHGLVAPSYAEMLTHLSVENCGIEAEGMKDLAHVFACGGLRSLEFLKLTFEKTTGTALAHFANGFVTVSNPLHLTFLHLSGTEINDAGVEALLSVVETGRLPALQVLILDHHCISDVGLTLLAQTVEGKHLDNLDTFSIAGKKEEAGQYQEGAILLATAVSAHCPKLQAFTLFGSLEESIRTRANAILETREDVRVSIY